MIFMLWYNYGIVFYKGVNMNEINLVLSGGGARGIAHLGVIKALQEFDFKINAVSGVSSGAIVAAFIGKGMAPEEILEVALSIPTFNLKKPPFHLGIFNKKNMQKVLVKYFEKINFSDLRIPVYISATNIITGGTEYFSKGEIIMPLIASSAIPVLFKPVTINGFQYIDGAVANNLPVEPFLGSNLARIGVCVNLLGEEKEISSALQVVMRTILIAVNKSAAHRKPLCNLMIEPPKLGGFSAFDFTKAKEIFDIGYENAVAALEKYISCRNEMHPSVQNLNAA